MLLFLPPNQFQSDVHKEQFLNNLSPALRNLLSETKAEDQTWPSR
jgi:hypothetical protein